MIADGIQMVGLTLWIGASGISYVEIPAWAEWAASVSPRSQAIQRSAQTNSTSSDGEWRTATDACEKTKSKELRLYLDEATSHILS
ncbi:uncharacterized protein N7500_004917 [Penicillium coprophilum]|uniref:uncharacterized protein n=1 Tax=Penicillium coprophilum TaxID=36646 RepID=UPI0023A0DB12|nr:uncharacterized protein N7500_004917 [Penicillium coprophilum]KAJ5163087.1 hypothetical protein N7500_004917 [Penicillium coprophilum]